MNLTERHSFLQFGAIALVLGGATVAALELDLDPTKIYEALAVARGTERSRATFHRPYLLTATDPSLKEIEVITEYRRLVLMTEERLLRGDWIGAQSLREAQETLEPFRRRVSIVARVRFSPQNALVTAPSVEISLIGTAGELPRLDFRNTTQYGQLPVPGGTTPLTGVDAEAVYDATAIGQNIRTVTVRLDGKEVGRAPVDFGRIE